MGFDTISGFYPRSLPSLQDVTSPVEVKLDLAQAKVKAQPPSPFPWWGRELQKLVQEESLLGQKRRALDSISRRQGLLSFYGLTARVIEVKNSLSCSLRRRQQDIDEQIAASKRIQTKVQQQRAHKLPLQRLRHLTIVEGDDVLRNCSRVVLRWEGKESKEGRKRAQGHFLQAEQIGRDHHDEKLRDQFLAVLGERAYRYRAMHKDRILLCGWRKCKRFPQGM